ncbi:MAG: hypothetical protein ACLQVJ_13790 [Syntrophobacteraceae bacterium]
MFLAIHHSPYTGLHPFTRFSSFFRFWLPYLLPLLVASSGCRFAGLIPFMIRYRLLQRIGEADRLWRLVSQFLTEENEDLKKPDGMLFAGEEKYLSVKSVVSSIAF